MKIYLHAWIGDWQRHEISVQLFFSADDVAFQFKKQRMIELFTWGTTHCKRTVFISTYLLECVYICSSQNTSSQPK